MKAIADKATWLSMLAIVISCLVVGWHYRSDSTFEDSSSASTDVDADGGAETEPSAEGDSEGSSEVARAAKGKPSRRGDGDGGQTVASYRPGKPDQSFELPVALSEISDLTLAGAILKARPSRPAPKIGAFEEAQW